MKSVVERVKVVDDRRDGLGIRGIEDAHGEPALAAECPVQDVGRQAAAAHAGDDRGDEALVPERARRTPRSTESASRSGPARRASRAGRRWRPARGHRCSRAWRRARGGAPPSARSRAEGGRVVGLGRLPQVDVHGRPAHLDALGHLATSTGADAPGTRAASPSS